MVNFSSMQLSNAMQATDRVRNISVIAHVDHGKSTLVDSLIASVGLLAKELAGEARFTDFSPMEQFRGITIKSTGVSLYYEDQRTNLSHLINLIDSPGHVDFSSEVTAALRVTDGAIVVVDLIEGVCVQTETVVRQARQELIRPVLMLNKLDRCFLQLEQDNELIYQNMVKVISLVNGLYGLGGDAQWDELGPRAGTVIFGSGKQQWAFSLEQFAALYQKKFDLSKEIILKKLWGDNFFNPATKTWSESAEDGGVRGFSYFVLNPIRKLLLALASCDAEQYIPLTSKLGLQLDCAKLKGLQRKLLIKSVMSSLFKADQCLFHAIVDHIPSPVQAQKYRTKLLVEGDPESQQYKAVQRCDTKGPLLIYISKIVPIGKGRFYSFGRIFSGTASVGQAVLVIPNKAQNFRDFHQRKIQRLALMMGKDIQPFSDIPAGNTIGLIGVEDVIGNCGSISSLSKFPAYIRPMKFAVSHVVRVAIRPENAADLPKLLDGIRTLEKTNNIKVQLEATGDIILAGFGELHIQICLSDLQTYANVPLKVSKPIVHFQQTITSDSGSCFAKSPNNHNKILGRLSPLDSCHVQFLEKEDIKCLAQSDKTKRLAEEFKFSKDETLKLWSFGPVDNSLSMLFDRTKAVQYLTSAKDHIVSSFQTVCNAGALLDQPLRGVNFDLEEAQFHADAVHRGPGQIIPMTRKLLLGAQLKAEPRIVEPFYMAEVRTPLDFIGGVYKVLTKRRINIISEDHNQEGVIVRVSLPVVESFGLSETLRMQTSGRAFTQLQFSHWEVNEESPLEEGRTKGWVQEFRLRKGLRAELPNPESLLDRMQKTKER